MGCSVIWAVFILVIMYKRTRIFISKICYWVDTYMEKFKIVDIFKTKSKKQRNNEIQNILKQTIIEKKTI